MSDPERDGRAATQALAQTERQTSTSPTVDTLVATKTSSGVREGDYEVFLPVDPAHYILEQEIARGGMGRILIARDRRLGRTVAVKEILGKDAATAVRFEREARITARLQHPSIVNIHEAGTWPSGDPFYVMKLVSGRSLDEVVAEKRELAERFELLPNVLAVADAIAYAHGERVIHRDLKPRNVLVGAFGETVVIDWGLAKELADPDDEKREPSLDGADDGVDSTRAGDVLGTPAYMPPEQAEGERVDARADVYAIGAMLDHVLSGAPPYKGRSSLAILDAVRTGPPVPLAERQPGVPPDLLAIVERAMARDPAARYPTARELAEDLRRYQTGQLVGAHRYSPSQLVMRWLRRHRTAVAVALVAMIVVAVFGVVSIKGIVDAKDRERRVREDAEALTVLMVTDFRDKLQRIGRVDLLADVAKRVVTYYEPRVAALDPSELLRYAQARVYVADALVESNTAAALAEYQAALAIHERLARTEPSPMHAQAVAATRSNIADVHRVRGEVTEALAIYRTALAELEAIATPGDTRRQQDIARVRQRIGSLYLENGDAAAALTEFRGAHAIIEAVATRTPTDLDAQYQLAISHNKLGDALFDQNDATGALGAYQSSLAIAETLHARTPDNDEWTLGLSVSYERVGRAQTAHGDTAAALNAYEKALAIDQALSAANPADLARQESTTISHDRVARVLSVRGDTAGALAHLEQALAIIEPLVRYDPSNVERQRRLAVLNDEAGDVRLAQGDRSSALGHYRAALAIRQRLTTADPANPKRQHELTASHDRVGDVLRANGDAAGALAAYRTSLGIREALLANDPSNVGLQRAVTISQERVGELLLERGELDAALVQLRASLAIRETLATSDPSNTTRKYEVAFAHVKLANALRARASADALAHYQKAQGIATQLQRVDPANADWKALAEHVEEKIATCCRS